VPAYAARLGVEREVWPYMAAAALLAVAGVTAAAMLQKRDHPVLMGLFMAVFLLTLSSGATRQASLYLQGTLHRYSLYMKHEAPPASRIVSYRLSKPSLVFYSGRFVERVWGEEELGAYLRKTRPRGGGCPIVAVTKAEDIKTLQDFGFRLVDTDGTYGLLKIP